MAVFTKFSSYYWLSHAYFSKYIKRLRRKQPCCRLHPCISCEKRNVKMFFWSSKELQTIDNLKIYQLMSINGQLIIFCESCCWYAAYQLVFIVVYLFLNRLESRLWKLVQNLIQIYLSSSCIGGFYLEHLSGLSATSWNQKSWWWHFSNLL